jgi:hypothetical protein
MKTYLSQQIDLFDINNGQYRVGLAQYTQGPDVTAAWQLNRHDTKSDILSAVLRLPFVRGLGKREIGKGVDYVKNKMFINANGDRVEGRNLLVLLTGADKSDDVYESYRAAERAEDAEINLYTVGFFMNDTQELQQISTWPMRDYHYMVNSGVDVVTVPANLFNSGKYHDLKHNFSA